MFQFDQCYINPPTTDSLKDGFKAIYPNDARLRNLTFVFPYPLFILA